MKRVVIILIMMMTSSQVTYAAENVVVTVPSYGVLVNNQSIDVAHSQYPIIEHKNITYFPMTYDYLAGIGLKLSFSNKEGLTINRVQSSESLNQSFLGANNILGSRHIASVANYPIKVNGTLINNLEEEYPVLTYNDITYFPMTWRFAVTEFGWATRWSDVEGFSIIVDQSNATVKSNDAPISNKSGTDEIEVSVSGEVQSDVQIFELDKIKEYVVIGNIGDSAVDISGWKLVSYRGAENQFLFFPTETILKPRQQLVIVSGNPKDQVDGDIIMANKPIWNNSSKDSALLYDNHGNLLQIFGE